MYTRTLNCVSVFLLLFVSNFSKFVSSLQFSEIENSQSEQSVLDSVGKKNQSLFNQSTVEIPGNLNSDSDSDSQIVESPEFYNASETHELTWTLNGMLRNYDKRIRPNFYGPPVKVGISIFVKSIASVSEIDMEYDLDFYLRQTWTDPRLKYEMKGKPLQVIGLSQEFAAQIWQPDTNFPNEKRSYIHSATMLNEFIRLFSDGRILKSTRLTLTASCPMNLTNFPMDRQICAVEIGSYGYTTSNIQYYWADGPNSVAKGINSVILPQFQVMGHRQKSKTSSTSTGTYGVLYCEFLFVRSLNFYLSQVYIPAALIVSISWLALFMTREQIAERMALGVTSVLTITTLLMSTNSNSPKISYIKAMDLYLGFCFCNVFASLLESAMIGYLSKKLKKRILKQALKLQLAEKIQPLTPIQVQRSFEKEKKLDVDVELDKANPNWPGMELEMDLENCPYDEDGNLSDVGTGISSRDFRDIEMELKANANANANGKKGGDKNATGHHKNHSIRIATIDVVSRTLFPLCFFVFNLLYWIYYLSLSESHMDDGGSWVN